MRRHEVLDTIGLATVFVLATVEALTHFGYRHEHGLCLGVPLMIISGLLLIAVHWPGSRLPRRDIPRRGVSDRALGAGPDRLA